MHQRHFSPSCRSHQLRVSSSPCFQHFISLYFFPTKMLFLCHCNCIPTILKHFHGSDNIGKSHHQLLKQMRVSERKREALDMRRVPSFGQLWSVQTTACMVQYCKSVFNTDPQNLWLNIITRKHLLASHTCNKKQTQRHTAGFSHFHIKNSCSSITTVGWES